MRRLLKDLTLKTKFITLEVALIENNIMDGAFSIQEEDRRILAWAMKYLREMLLGYEIFLKIFEGPQKICLSSFSNFF